MCYYNSFSYWMRTYCIYYYQVNCQHWFSIIGGIHQGTRHLAHPTTLHLGVPLGKSPYPITRSTSWQDLPIRSAVDTVRVP